MFNPQRTAFIITGSRLLLAVIVLLQAAPLAAQPTPAAPVSSTPPSTHSSPTQPLTLAECVTRALNSSEDLAVARNGIEQAQQRYRQAINELAPEFNIVAQQRLRGPSNFGVLASVGSDVSTDPAGRRSRGLGASQFDTALTVTQPLFRGFREFLLADAATAEQRRASALERRNKELLYQEVALAYHQTLLYQDDLVILGRLKENLAQRVTELQEFTALGRTRESEVVAAQADLAAVAVIRERILGLRAATREYLSFLTNTPATELRLQSARPTFTMPALSPLLQQSRSRSDTLAAAAAVDAATLKAKAIRRELWPNASLDGSAYAVDDPNRNREWEMLLRVEIPLFDSGRIDARATESEISAQSASLMRDRIQRQIELEVRQGVATLSSAIAEYQALSHLVNSRRRNYELQRADYTLGVVTNLEVLSAIRQLYDSERQLREAEASVAVAETALTVAVGGLPV